MNPLLDREKRTWRYLLKFVNAKVKVPPYAHKLRIHSLLWERPPPKPTKTGKDVASQKESSLYSVQTLPPIKLLKSVQHEDTEGRKYYNPPDGFSFERQDSLQTGEQFLIVRAAKRKRGTDQDGDRWPEIGQSVGELMVKEVGQDFTHSVTSRKTNWVIMTQKKQKAQTERKESMPASDSTAP